MKTLLGYAGPEGSKVIKREAAGARNVGAGEYDDEDDEDNKDDAEDDEDDAEDNEDDIEDDNDDLEIHHKS